MLSKLKFLLWQLIYGSFYRFCYLCIYTKRKQLSIFDSVSTIRYILDNGCSVSRFGDGEFQMITHIGYWSYRNEYKWMKMKATKKVAI